MGFFDSLASFEEKLKPPEFKKGGALEHAKGGFAPVSGVKGVGAKMFGTTPITFAWSKLGTTSKVLIGAGAGATAYAGYDWLFGGKKAVPQKQDLQQALQPIQITKTYSPVTTTTITTTNANTYQIQSDSPGAYQAFDKKDAISSSPAVGVSPSWAIQPSQAASQSAEQKQESGTDFLKIAAVLGIAYLGASYLGRKKRK